MSLMLLAELHAHCLQSELKQEYWPRLTKDKKKQPWIKTDFERWVDEDEQDAQEDLDQGMGGMPGGGMGVSPRVRKLTQCLC